MDEILRCDRSTESYQEPEASKQCFPILLLLLVHLLLYTVVSTVTSVVTYVGCAKGRNQRQSGSQAREGSTERFGKGKRKRSSLLLPLGLRASRLQITAPLSFPFRRVPCKLSPWTKFGSLCIQMKRLVHTCDISTNVNISISIRMFTLMTEA